MQLSHPLSLFPTPLLPIVPLPFLSPGTVQLNYQLPPSPSSQPFNSISLPLPPSLSLSLSLSVSLPLPSFLHPPSHSYPLAGILSLSLFLMWEIANFKACAMQILVIYHYTQQRLSLSSSHTLRKVAATEPL